VIEKSNKNILLQTNVYCWGVGVGGVGGWEVGGRMKKSDKNPVIKARIK